MQIEENHHQKLSVYYLSEQAVTIEFGDAIDEVLMQQVVNFDHLLHQKPFSGFCAAVPAYTTLSVFFDPVQVSKSVSLPGADCFEKVSWYLNELKKQPVKEVSFSGTKINIPVCYGGVFGPDLDEMAQLHHLSATEIIEPHSAAVYKVYLIGFVPGFAYLGGMPTQLASARKPTPRKAVPAGSIGIAGEQTGIYPMEIPGGWQIIGCTPMQLFDAERPQPALLKAGDQVVFSPISSDEFMLISNQKYAGSSN